MERTGVGIYKINERAVSVFVGIFCGKREPSAFCLIYSFYVLDTVQTDTSVGLCNRFLFLAFVFCVILLFCFISLR